MCSYKLEKTPPIGLFLRFLPRLETLDQDNLSEKLPKVSASLLKYSRFLETLTGDRVRSALRDVDAVLTQRFARRSISAFGSKEDTTLIVESVILLVDYIHFWRRFIELQRTGFHSTLPSLGRSEV